SFDEKYNREYQLLILDQDESFVFNNFFPDAPVVLEVRVRRDNQPQNLNIFIDDEFLESRPVSRVITTFQFQIPPSPGNHTISIKPEIIKPLQKKRQTPPRLFISWVNLATKNDVVLFFVPQSRQQEFSGNNLHIRYYSELNEQKEVNPYASLYRIKNDFTLDPHSPPENPENLKKQITLEDLSLDVMMAPPSSRFEYMVKIPEKGRLDFGTGFFNYQADSNQKDVLFVITAELKGQSKTLFEKVVQIQDRLLREQLESHSIDLSEYAGKSVLLSFITKDPAGDESVQPVNPAFSFWVNPVVYRPEPDGLKVILVSLDTLRADHVGAYGYPRGTTPFLDRLTEDSVLFENTYAQSPWTLPSHMSLLFSLNTASHQVYYNDQKINSAIPSLASYLKEQGFLTHAFTGGGYVNSTYGFSKGFDGYEDPVGGQKAVLQDDEASQLFEKTSRWLRENKDKKFFLFLHTFQVHGPYRCPSPWDKVFLEPDAKWDELALRNFLDNNGDDYSFSDEEKRNIIALYDGEINYTDEVLIKPLIEQLKEMGIYDNTLLIITADHGEEFQDHGGWLHGGTLYNEALKVPLIMKFPHSRFKGTRIPSVVRLIDVMPTVLDNAGFGYKNLDGKTLMEYIRGKETEDRIYISDLAYKNVPVPCPSLYATNRGWIKFIVNRSEEGVKSIETYDLQADNGEQNNIFREYQAMRTEVVKLLQDYYEEKQKLPSSTERIRMGKALEEKLRALGYLR
ncbi:MAG: sulfatase, partial [Candidatus Aminicenantes bacterium]|nr:sulfatase [Candidatus Aminicenantes bacterium]